jgi:hypothetical protein
MTMASEQGHSRRARRAAWAVGAGVLALMVAACGGGSSGGEDGSQSKALGDEEFAHAKAKRMATGSRQRMVRVPANWVVDTADAKLAIVDRAKAVGANTVVLNDPKFMIWALGGSLGDRWAPEMRRFVDGVKQRKMKLVLDTITLGYCSAMLTPDVNLTTGYPIIDQALRAQGDKLVPVSTASIANGGFEESNGNTILSWDFQDAAGERTFVDTAVKRSGNASFRADARDGQSSRAGTSFAVKPWHQYVVSFWIKTEGLTASTVLPLLLAGPTNEFALTSQNLSVPAADGSRSYFSSPRNLTRDWTEVRIAFNSRQFDRVSLGLSTFGGSAGSIWWDDVAITDAPTLNWLVRDDLPRSAKLQADGSAVAIGSDIAEPVDPRLGQSGFTGAYATDHDAPQPAVLNAGRVSEGATVLLSGWHAQVTMRGQVACSWNNPRIYAQMRTVHERLNTEYRPDGFLLDISEVRTGGFEPSDTAFGSSGAALAASIRRAITDIGEVAPRAKVFFWSDMADENHNAKESFEQINGSLVGTWRGLDPRRVIVLNWWERTADINAKAAKSLQFFADRGFKQVIAGFYDIDVAENHGAWQAAAKGVPGIIGSMYTTYADDFSAVEAFAPLWWGAP